MPTNTHATRRKILLFILCLMSRVVGGGEAGEAAVWRPASMTYLLQADARYKSKAATVRGLAACGRDLIVIDATWTTGEAWTKKDINSIRAGKAGRKVVAYLSIGEAETYRPYWKKSWDANKDGKPDNAAPAFLGEENPDWSGNFRVRYWQADWQAIILRALDTIVAQGFDGVYLDIVDGFEFFERDGKKYIDDRKNPVTGKTYREDMIAFVKNIAHHARQKPRHESFLVIPQNGVQLLADDTYRETISAIGIEDLYTIGNKKQPSSHTKYVLVYLRKLQAIPKPVLVIEYARRDFVKKKVIERARTDKVTLLLTDRPLKTLGEARNIEK